MVDTLVSKIAKAAVEVGGKLSVDKTNLEQHYDYISADKVLSEGGQALAHQGVIIIPSVATSETAAIDRGNSKYRYDAKVTFDFCVTDGEKDWHVAWVGVGSDYSTPDKAQYKAYTSGHKTFLMKLLCIGAGNEDGEHEDSEPEQSKRNGKPATQQNAAKPNSNGQAPKATTPPQQKSAEQSAQPNGNSKPAATSDGMPLEQALQFKTGEGKFLGDMTWAELEANEKKALTVPKEKRQENWNKAYAALQAVMQYRKAESDAARAEMTEGADE